MPMNFSLNPWYRIGEGQYINLQKVTDITFHREESQLYAICQLENGSKLRVTGEEAGWLKVLLENCNATNLINTIEAEALLQSRSGVMLRRKFETEDESEECFSIDLDELFL